MSGRLKNVFKLIFGGIFNPGVSNFQTPVQYEPKKGFFDVTMVVFYARQLPVLPTFALKSKRCLIKSYCRTSFVSGVMKNKKSIIDNKDTAK